MSGLNQSEVIRMARQAGSMIEAVQEKDLQWLERFAALVASAEREACAKLCWSQRKYWDAEACADAIRARGQ
jgi:hypothetical protein